MSLTGWVVASDGALVVLGKVQHVADDDSPLVLGPVYRLHGGNVQVDGDRVAVQPMMAVPLFGLLDDSSTLSIDATSYVDLSTVGPGDVALYAGLIAQGAKLAEQLRAARSGIVAPGPKGLELLKGGR
jgi:hypothetical protein